MRKVLNIFAIDVGLYVKKAPEQKLAFSAACHLDSGSSATLFRLNYAMIGVF